MPRSDYLNLQAHDELSSRALLSCSLFLVKGARVIVQILSYSVHSASRKNFSRSIVSTSASWTRSELYGCPRAGNQILCMTHRDTLPSTPPVLLLECPPGISPPLQARYPLRDDRQYRRGWYCFGFVFSKYSPLKSIYFTLILLWLWEA